MTQVTISAETLDALTIEGLRQARDSLRAGIREAAAKGHWRDVQEQAERHWAAIQMLEYFGVDQ